MDLVTVLEKLHSGVSALSPHVSGPVGTVVKVLEMSLGAAAAFASAGMDPVAQIQRIHDADPLLLSMRADWEERMRLRFDK
jgi:hypothetical protein